MNTRLFGMLCIIGGLVYIGGGVWTGIAGTPQDANAFRLAHMFSLIWALGSLSGLFGMYVTRATGSNRLAHAMIAVPAIGLALVGIDAAIGVLNASPALTGNATPLAAIGRLLLLIGFLILTILVWKAKQWSGWTKFVPLGVFLAPFIGLALGGLLGLTYFQLVIIGLSWVLAGLAVLTQPVNTAILDYRTSPIENHTQL